MLSLTVSNFGCGEVTFGRKMAAELAKQSFVEIFGIAPRRRGGGDNGAASVSLWGPCWVLGSTGRRARSWPGPFSRRVDDSVPLIRAGDCERERVLGERRLESAIINIVLIIDMLVFFVIDLYYGARGVA